ARSNVASPSTASTPLSMRACPTSASSTSFPLMRRAPASTLFPYTTLFRSLVKNTESQRRLYDLGIFARVNTAVQDPDGDEDEKYVLYDFDEARHYSMNVGVGAQIGRIGGGVTTLDNPAGTAGFAPRFAFGISRI